MRGHCPDCEGSLEIHAGERVEAAICLGCGGAWLDSEAMPALQGVDGNEVSQARVSARFAQGRCSKSGHPMRRKDAQCPCGSAPASCPACDAPLSRVRLHGSPLDACSSCGGLWLTPIQARELAGIDRSKMTGIGLLGAGAGLKLRARRSVDPFRCSRCERSISALEAHAKDGLMYCERCWAELQAAPARSPLGLLRRAFRRGGQ